jgi:hypothetical protein
LDEEISHLLEQAAKSDHQHLITCAERDELRRRHRDACR